MKIEGNCGISSESGENRRIFALEIADISLNNNDLGILSRALSSAHAYNVDSGSAQSETRYLPPTPNGARDLLGLALAICATIALAHGTVRPNSATPNGLPKLCRYRCGARRQPHNRQHSGIR